jgi:ABC-type antimicrobial peptide transport system permease subunit
MSTLRWQKAWKDLIYNKSRTMLVILSIAVGVMAFGSIVGARETINRDLTASYQAARPEDVTLHTTPFTDSLVRSVARLPQVEAAASTAQALDAAGNVTTPGSRIQSITLADGTPIVSGGAVVDGPALTVATIDFLAGGGDQYPFRGTPFTQLGVTYQQALSDYIQLGLGGVISAAQYSEIPVGGGTRITTATIP